MDEYYASSMLLTTIFDKLLPILILVVLPILIVWLSTRAKINSNNNRTQIILSAIEKNPNVDIKDLLAIMEKPQKPLKDRLIPMLIAGAISASVGAVIAGGSIPFALQKDDDFWALTFFGGIVFVVGAVLLLVYYLRMRSEEKN